MLRCAIVGVGRWGQRLVDSCQKLGQPCSESLHFTHAVARTPEKYANYCLDQQHAETKIYSETDIEFAELKAFAEACQNGASYPVTLEEAVHGIAVQDAIIESAQSSGSRKSIAQHSTWHPAARDEEVFAASRVEGRV